MLPTALKNEGESEEIEEGSIESYDVLSTGKAVVQCERGESSCSLTIVKFMRAEEVKLLLY